MIKNYAKRFFLILVKKISPTLFLKLIYFRATGSHLNLKKPKIFNEKIQWLKLYDYPANELVLKAADKYLITSYLENKKLVGINARLLGCWDNFDEIDFSLLPKKFVLKTNNASGTNYFCKDKTKIDLVDLREKFNSWLKQDYGSFSLEKHYSKMEAKIIAEEYLDFSDENIEYNFYCFNGIVKFCKVISFDNKETKSGKGRCYDTEWNDLPFDYEKNKLEKVNKPKDYQYMLEICKSISNDFDFVRVDFFQCKDNVILGELTFSPASGFATGFNDFAQDEMGNWLKISKFKN